MTRFALKSISSRRLRTALTALAIVLGVAMVSGAYTLTDTMRGAADSLSKASYEGTAAVVSAKTAFDVDADDFGQRPTLPAGALEEVAAHAPRAVGSISDEARLLDPSGDVIGSGPLLRSRARPRGAAGLARSSSARGASPPQRGRS